MSIRDTFRALQERTESAEAQLQARAESWWHRRRPMVITAACALALGIGVALAFCTKAQAAPTAGLTVICDKPTSEGKFVGDCNADLAAGAPSNDRYDLATPESLVRSCKDPAAGGCDWNDQVSFVYRKLKDLPPTSYTHSCADPLEPGTREPNPWSWDVSKCKNWKPILVASVLRSTVNTANSLVLYWSPVTTDTTGAPITGVMYSVYDNGVRVAQAIESTTYTATNVSPGAHSFELTAWYGANESARSAKLPYMQGGSLPQIPATPGPLHVTDMAAFDLVKVPDGLTVKQIGTVPADTACNAAVQALGYFGVPRAKVALKGTNTRPQVVLAKCSP